MSSDSKILLIRTDSFPHINHRQGRGVYSCSTPNILCQLLHLHICCYRNHSRNIKSRIIRYVWYIFEKLEQLHDLNKMISVSLGILNSKLLKDKTSSTFMVTFVSHCYYLCKSCYSNRELTSLCNVTNMDLNLKKIMFQNCWYNNFSNSSFPL